MITFHPASVLAFGVAAFVALLVVLPVVRAIRRRRRSIRRVVEKPNSHYTPALARDSIDRHRWHDMALDRVHEINREEVLRLLAKVEAQSMAALDRRERAFLDRIAELAGRSA